MATFRLSGENKKVSVVRRTRPVHVRNTLSVFLTEKTEGFCNGLEFRVELHITVRFPSLPIYQLTSFNPQLIYLIFFTDPVLPSTGEFARKRHQSEDPAKFPLHPKRRT